MKRHPKFFATILMWVAFGFACADFPEEDTLIVLGEKSAGHPRPKWIWSVPPGTEAFRYRLNNNAWTIVDPSVNAYFAETDFEEGMYRFEVQARKGLVWSSSAVYETVVEYFRKTGFFDGIKRNVALSPQNHPVGMACHNCYVTIESISTANLVHTREKLNTAQNAGADFLELDVKFEQGEWYVEHNDAGMVHGALFANVLADDKLKNGSEILFIEIKETSPTYDSIRALIRAIVEKGYAVNGRPVVLRSFYQMKGNIQLAKEILDSGEFFLNQHYFRLSILFTLAQSSAWSNPYGWMDEVRAFGVTLVEFDVRSGNLNALIAFARSRHLGVALWTLPSDFGGIYCSRFKNSADIMITEYPVGTCRNIVEDVQ